MSFSFDSPFIWPYPQGNSILLQMGQINTEYLAKFLLTLSSFSICNSKEKPQMCSDSIHISFSHSVSPKERIDAP